jgi:2-amino-4-hydroxy-6-hydroxymethyldihydropteridine diphosphokinase
MANALLGFGGNVGDVRTTLTQAVAAFADGNDVKLRYASSHYRTPPWGVLNQPRFINMAISADTELPPKELLQRAMGLEASFGRDRSQGRWGPRTLDIDLLSYGDVVIDEPGLILPHPRMFERAFVLIPLNEIVPGRVIAGRNIKQALAQLDDRGVERLPALPRT